MLLASSSPWLDAVRAAPRRLMYALSVIGAGLGFLALTHGKGLGNSGNALAYVEAIHYSVAPMALGRIDKLSVQVGQRVKAGEAIAIMDGRELQAAREKSVLQLAQLEAEVVASAQDQEFQVTRSELWVLKARADERGDRAALAQISERMQRLDGLLDKQMIPAAQAEIAREKQKELSARVETFDQAKVRGQAGLGQVGAGNHDHAHAVAAHVEPARRAVEVQQAAIRQLDLQIEQLTLRAPIDGVVTTITHRPGEIVAAGSEVLSVVSARPGVLVVELPEGMAARARLGQGVSVRSKELFSRALHGRIIELAPEVDEMFVRARPSPGIAAWGRRATVQLDGGGEVLPGQAFSVSLD
ncbi:MAG TPA: efflux RND transporter periplasmic adaptor subunit [Polyangiaceae bacterium]|nr:efflux RND transporter periplasmic adaptor subunit [Polyangiaceae bacterium]